MGKIWADIQAILTHPVTDDLDMTHLFLLVGLILVMIAAWIFILKHIEAATIEVIDT